MHLLPWVDNPLLFDGGDDPFALGRDGHLGHVFYWFWLKHPEFILGVYGFGVR